MYSVEEKNDIRKIARATALGTSAGGFFFFGGLAWAFDGIVSGALSGLVAGAAGYIIGAFNGQDVGRAHVNGVRDAANGPD